MSKYLNLLFALLLNCQPLPQTQIPKTELNLPRVVVLDILDAGVIDWHCLGVEIAGERVVTAAHCVDGAQWIGARYSLDEISYRAYDVERLDLVLDLAVLAPYGQVRSAHLYDLPQDVPERGDAVLFYNKRLVLHSSVIEGYSCVRTDLADRLCVYRLAHYPERGNSGAPVYSEAGCLIGIIVAGDFERGLTYFSPTLFLSSP